MPPQRTTRKSVPPKRRPGGILPAASPSRNGGKQRIAKLLARAGVASRREVERMIADGRVALNGEKLTTPATLLEDLHGVTVDGRPVRPAAERARRRVLHFGHHTRPDPRFGPSPEVPMKRLSAIVLASLALSVAAAPVCSAADWNVGASLASYPARRQASRSMLRTS